MASSSETEDPSALVVAVSVEDNYPEITPTPEPSPEPTPTPEPSPPICETGIYRGHVGNKNPYTENYERMFESANNTLANEVEYLPCMQALFDEIEATGTNDFRQTVIDNSDGRPHVVAVADENFDNQIKIFFINLLMASQEISSIPDPDFNNENNTFLMDTECNPVNISETAPEDICEFFFVRSASSSESNETEYDIWP